jgi:hypothetical protein
MDNASTNRTSLMGAIISPIRKFFGGVLATLLAGTMVYLIFNNPKKIKGRATLQAWHSIIQYEQMYDENVILITCNTPLTTTDNIKEYKSDIVHQIQLTGDNFQNIKEEGNVDNLLFAIVNLKADTYNEIKTITGGFLDSLVILSDGYDKNEFPNMSDDEFLQNINRMVTTFNNRRQHLLDRDTATVTNVLEKLTESYTYPVLYKYSFTKKLPDQDARFKQNIIGKWALYGGNTLEVNPDNTAIFIDNGYERKCKWKYENEQLTLSKKDSGFYYNVILATDKAIRLRVKDEGDYIGCRK